MAGAWATPGACVYIHRLSHRLSSDTGNHYLDSYKVLIGDWQSGRRLLIIWDEDVGEDIGTGEAILPDGEVGDSFDCAKHQNAVKSGA